MAETVPLETPWTTPQAIAWDQHTLHQWLAAHVGPARARTAIARAIEGVCASGPGGTSLLAALFGIHAGDALGPFVAAQAPVPAHRCAGGAQQLAGALFGSALVGGTDSLVASLWSPVAAQLVVFTLAVIVIRLCPEGLYARVRGR